ncbi:MAG: hypothetical protein EAZ89_20330 [Bacteroidetes bacterium]|nr:MAG: hypothetical protein EAZ89_20330 [Bacteroidota bacterium]
MNLLLPEKADLLYEKLVLATTDERSQPGDRIRKIRPLLEALFRELIHDETQAFPNLFSASAYIFDRYEVAAELRDEINGLRKLCNKVVHEADFQVNSDQYEAAVQVLSHAVEYFSGRPVPEELSRIYSGKNLKGLREARSPRGESIPFVRAVVHGIAERQLSASGTHFCDLQLESEDPAFGEFSLRLWDAFGEESEAWLKFSKAGEWLRSYATLHLMNLRSQPERPGHYSSTAETLMVLEPDYLLEATEMAECFMENRGIVFDNYRLAILGRFVPSEPGLPLVVGQIVNQLLDQLLLDPGAGIADAMRTTLRENVLPAVRIGEDQLKDLAARRGETEEQLQRLLAPNL